VANYRFGARIGSGGFGLVVHATRIEDGLPFAAKRLLPEHADDEEIVRRFRREVRMQRSLEHPNVLPIVGYNLSASPPWFIMPIAERTLLDEIATGLSDSEVTRIFNGVLAGVAHAHENGVLHRDLKPENVLMSHDNVPQVSDFGLGKNVLSDSTVLTQTSLGAGSFPYIAPEQMISLRDADERADVYALGKILQAMVTGTLPVLHTDRNVPRRYQYFISRCTAQEREDRYQTVADVIAAFEQVARGEERPRAAREIADELVSEWLQLRARPSSGSAPTTR
jgi:serine/threonine protein kinase